jgi:filamentous hemagglutinin
MFGISHETAVAAITNLATLAAGLNPIVKPVGAGGGKGPTKEGGSGTKEGAGAGDSKGRGGAGGTKGESPETVMYFRVEGGGSGTKTSQNRIIANEDGTITINPGCAGQICVSVGNADHATYYLTNKRPDGSVVVFDVDAGLHKEIMDRVIPQKPVPGIPRDPDAPKRVDPGQPGYSLELPKVWESLLEKNSSNARVYTQDEFLKEFGK